MGNPCDPATGNKIEVEVGYEGAGPLPLRFERTYNLLSRRAGSSLGSLWHQNYDRSLAVGDAGDAVVQFRDDGAAVTYRGAGPSCTADADVTDALEAVAGVGFKLNRSDGELVETYDAAGKLVSIANRAGVTQALSYFATGPNAGMLESVTDHFGRTLRFAYTVQDFLVSMTDPAGNVTRYDYDSTGRLASVFFPDSTPTDPADDPRRSYS